MKTFYFLTLLSVLACVAQAKVITVDNNEGAGADFSSISAAINSASNGDSIYVHASHHDYGNISINKKIYLIGPGHYPESTGYQAASVSFITLKSGSSGTLITGLKIDRIECSVWNVAEDITIENNFIGYSWYIISGPFGDNSDGDNWIIRGNILIEPVGCGGCSIINVNKSASGNDNWLIANNIIISKNSQPGSPTGIFKNLNGSTTIINNTIIHRNNEILFFGLSTNPDSYNALFKNNIIVSLSTSITDITSGCIDCLWENNITYSPNATLGGLPGTGNINNVDPAFLDVPDSYEWSYDSDFNVQETSAASNAGTDGTDLGAFGGNFNFSKYGFPYGIPIVEQFRIENQLLNAGEKLRFSIKARAADSRSN